GGLAVDGAGDGGDLVEERGARRARRQLLGEGARVAQEAALLLVLGGGDDAAVADGARVVGGDVVDERGQLLQLDAALVGAGGGGDSEGDGGERERERRRGPGEGDFENQFQHPFVVRPAASAVNRPGSRAVRLDGVRCLLRQNALLLVGAVA